MGERARPRTGGRGRGPGRGRGRRDETTNVRMSGREVAPSWHPRELGDPRRAAETDGERTFRKGSWPGEAPAAAEEISPETVGGVVFSSLSVLSSSRSPAFILLLLCSLLLHTSQLTRALCASCVRLVCALCACEWLCARLCYGTGTRL